MTDVGVSPAEEAAAVGGHALRRAAWLSDEILLLACAPEAGGSASEPATVCTRVEARAFAAARGTILAAAVPPELLERPGPLAFVDEDGGATLVAEAGAVAGALGDLRTLLREGPAAWDVGARTALLGFLAALGVEHGLSPSLSDGLHGAREALRERRPVVVDDRRADRGVCVEQLLRIDDTSFYVRGRAWDLAGPLTTLAAISPEGERVELLEGAFRYGHERADFITWFETTAPSRRDEGWVVEVASGASRTVETSAELGPDGMDVLLADAALELPGAESPREQHVRPAISRLQELRRAATAVAGIDTYGAVPRRPAVSLVVPLGRRVDLVEHQLAQFASDPALRECELLYMLNDPEQREFLRELASGLFRLYDLPFRVAELSCSGGLPIACNLAASVASGRRLVLLHPDVLPDRPGWLDVLANVCDAEPGAGAVAAKLLYEDEAIEHAGMEYRRPEGAAEWLVEHRFRGLHRTLPAANLGGPVPAVSAACLMIDAGLFRDVGGLSTEYAHGGYEASDLSRRLAATGRRTWYAPEAELYHLDALGDPVEAAGERYDRWLHTRLWGGAIEAATA